MSYLLVGDIGGTKGLLRLIDQNGQPLYTNRYEMRNFPHLEAVIEQFLTDVKVNLQITEKPQMICLGIAGSIVGDECRMVNLGWVIDRRAVSRHLEIERVVFINDFTAVGYGVLGLDKQDLLTLQNVTPVVGAPIGVIGAGTGLGEGFLIKQGEGYQVYPTEGGHTEFAPRSLLEIELLKYLQQKFGRVSVERVVSGQGITNIYAFLHQYYRAEHSNIYQAVIDSHPDAPALIAQAARNKTDSIAAETIAIFLDCYAREVGDFALKLLAYGGIYIAGGILPKLLNLCLVDQGKFLATIKDKGRVSHLLDHIPFHIVLHPEVGLIGAGILAITLTKSN
ncbi:MAG: glucokinase [Pseudanabaenaceae cyanobacterium SKYGB_i_bin29]|nr:glucokinase [Pseudanabaenaceae cyanobacterium SKYG29]MDW8420653.1 glucokinase [Pseudanabaenaceae cyanobacterium SKYGB_i_bin29]